MKFRTRGRCQDGTSRRNDTLLYILGLSHGNLSVRNKILSFPGALPGFAFSPTDKTTTHLTGAIRWLHDPERTRFRRSYGIWNKDDFLSYGTLLLGPQFDYLYPKVMVKMRAEEILQLTLV